jgi:hypothetical protein
VWSDARSPVSIEFAPETLDAIRREAGNSFLFLPRGGLEIGGVLFGIKDNDLVWVTAFRKITCDHVFGPTFTLAENEDRRIGELVDKAASDPLLKDLAPVGWFRSRTRSELIFDEQDHQLLERWFPEEWHTALVIKPELNYGARAAIFFRQVEGGQVVGSVEFSIGNGGSLHPPAPREPAVPAASPVSASAAAPPEILPSPSAPRGADTELPVMLGPIRETTPRVQGRLAGWSAGAVAAAVLVALAAGAAGGVAGSLTYGERFLRGERIALAATERDGQLHIEWNRMARPVLEARTAVLEIRDGEMLTPIMLDREMLRRGSIFYQRHNSRIDATLRLVDERLQSTSDLISFVAPRQAPK